MVAQIVAAEAAGPLGMSASTLRVAECILRVVAPNPLPQPRAMHAGCHQHHGLRDEARNAMTDLETAGRLGQIYNTPGYACGPLPQRNGAECAFDSESVPCFRWVTDGWVTVEGVSLATKRAYEGATVKDATTYITPPVD